MKFKILLIIFFVVGLKAVHAQTIMGRVYAAADSIPLIGASIQQAGTNITAITRSDGSFILPVQSLPVNLKISFMGYQTEMVLVDASANLPLIVYLNRSDNQLKEVVVSTGYQEQSMQSITGSVSTISQEQLQRTPGTDILDRIETLAPGVVFDRRLGGRPEISIRGISTIYGNTAPLIVLDNFPYEGRIEDINPNDIENITILKDAASAAIWGVRAGNGVIVITSKKGRYRQTPSYSFIANTSIQSAPDLSRLPLIPSGEFIALERFLFDKAYYKNLETSASKPVLSPAVEIMIRQRDGLISAAEANAQLSALGNVDIRESMNRLYQNGINQQYSLSTRGGTENLAYNFAAGYDKNINTSNAGFNRLTLRSDNTIRPFKNAEIVAGLRYTRSNSTGGNLNYQGLAPGVGKGLIPYLSLVDENGNPAAIPRDYRTGFKANAAGQGLLNWDYVPLLEGNYTESNAIQNDLLVNTGIKYRIIPSLKAEALYQYELNNGNLRTLQQPESYAARDLINRFSQINGGSVFRVIPQGGILNSAQSALAAHSFRGQLDYNTSWKKHNLHVLGGADLREVSTKGLASRTYGYDDEKLTFYEVDYNTRYPMYYNPNALTTIPSGSGFTDKINRYTSLFGILNYSFDQRYNLSASLRKDASNLFGVDQNMRGVPLWSLGVAWNINEEKFFHADFMPSLKLRLTYGYNGNTDPALSAYSIMSYSQAGSLIGQPYAKIISPPNPSLRWEKTGTWNAGIDFGSRDQILTGSVDYYHKKGIDLIGDSPLDQTTGVTDRSGNYVFRGNVASMKGQGMEVQLHSKNLRRTFNWNTDLIWSWNTNKVTDYVMGSTRGSTYLNTGYGIVPIVGKPLYSMFGYQWAGLDPQTGDPLGMVSGAVSKDYANIFNTTQLDDLVYFGQATPVMSGSLINTFSVKNLSLSFNISYKFGHYYRRQMMNYGAFFSSWQGVSEVVNRWKQPGDELRTNVPSLIYPNNTNRDTFYAGAAVNIADASNIRFQDLRLSYLLTQKAVKNLPFKNMQVIGAVRNVGILWRATADDTDPDYGTQLAPAPEYSLGLRVDL